MEAQGSGEWLLRLEFRFQQHPERHPGVTWATAHERLHGNIKTWPALAWMEDTGGEPDVVGIEEGTGRLMICDCAAQSPVGRRSLCYDERARLARRENRPAGSAVAQAEAMGLQILNESQYRRLQCLGEFDTKSSSWIETPQPIRILGGALFCDRRYDAVFTYHNGAESYYAARGFRAILMV